MPAPRSGEVRGHPLHDALGVAQEDGAHRGRPDDRVDVALQDLLIVVRRALPSHMVGVRAGEVPTGPALPELPDRDVVPHRARGLEEDLDGALDARELLLAAGRPEL